METSTAKNTLVHDHWNDFACFLEELEKSLFESNPSCSVDLSKRLEDSKCNRDRIEVCLTNEHLINQLNKHVDQLLAEFDPQTKDDVKAAEIRQKADEMFEGDYFADALEAYSAAIAKAELSRSTSSGQCSELARCFQKRAEVLFVLKKYDLCLQDIDLAVLHGYEPIAKLTELKNDCESKLANRCESDEKLSTANEHGNESSEADFCWTSDQVQIKREANKGRLIAAATDVNFGDRILVERPFAVLLDQDYYLAFCSFCLKQLKGNGVPCRSCDHALYCNDRCRQQADQLYHSRECNRTLDLQNVLGIAYLPIRILFRVGLERILSLDWDQVQPKQNQATETNSETESKVIGDYQNVLQLMSHESELDNEIHLKYAITSVLLKLLLVKMNVITLQSPEEELKLCTLFLLHLQQMHSNLVSVVNHVMLEQFSKEGLEGGEQMEIGVGIYPALSLFNHSCQPNVLSMFSGSEVQISAARAVKAGEELFFCYGPSVQSATRRDRQEALKRQYFFDCKCIGCTNGVESRSRALLCQKCNGAVIENNDRTNQCLNCGLVNQPIDHKAIEKAMGLMQNGRTLMKSDNYYKALSIIVEAYEELIERFHRHNSELRKCLEDLCECYAMIGYHDIAASYCEIVLKITREVFGADSIEAGNERVKLASLRFQIIQRLAPSEKVEVKARSEELAKDIGDIIDQFERLQVQVKQRLNEKQKEQFVQFDELEILKELKVKVNQLLDSN